MGGNIPTLSPDGGTNMTAKYTLTLHGFCGMPIPLAEGDREDVRQAAAKFLLRRRRQEYTVSTLETGTEWEISDSDDSVMVSDLSGVLHIRQKPVPMIRCWACGEDVPKEDGCDCQTWEDEETTDEESDSSD